jgi:hypothetical protein
VACDAANHQHFQAGGVRRRLPIAFLILLLAIAESHHKGATKANGESLFLDETGRQWLKQYAPGKLRAKKIELYAKMEGARTL